MDIRKCKEEYVKYCHFIQEKNLVFGSGGNVSVRVGDIVLITPSGRSLESLTVEDVIELSFDGSFKGEGRPSSEYKMHLGCYQVRPEITAVVHTHSLYATAVSCLKDLDPEKAMPIFTPGYGKRVGALPVIPYLTPGSRELADMVSQTIAKRNSVLLKNHGLVAVGKDWESALNLAEELEENAQITLMLSGRGEELTPQQLAGLASYHAEETGKGV